MRNSHSYSNLQAPIPLPRPIELFFKPPTPSYRVLLVRKTALRVLIKPPRDFMSYFGAVETNLYIEVQYKIKDPFKVRRPRRRKSLRESFGFKSQSTRGPGRRDTCHLTDFFQTFTVYGGHYVIQDSRVVRAPGLSLEY